MLSVNEPTWSKELKMHVCCGSTHSYHQHSCPVRKSKIPGRASDPIFVEIQRLKTEEDMNSEDVARELNIPLEQVNELWTP